MTRNSYIAFVLIAGGFLLTSQTAVAQRHELGLTLGALMGGTRSSPPGPIELGAGIALEANYGYSLLNRRHVALFGEVHFLANPLRDISSSNAGVTRDVATLFVVPGLRVKFRPASRLSPYVAAGGGYALYEQSFYQIDGGSNPAPRFTHRGAFGFGGGADLKLWRFVSARWEIRDFYTGSPSFNAPAPGGQHNLVAGGGFVLRFSRGGER